MTNLTTSKISIYMDSKHKKATKTLCKELDMNLSITSNISPNRETVSAMLEAERLTKDSSVKGYHNVDDFFTNLDK